MDQDERNLRARREIISGYLVVLRDVDRLVRTCWGTEGGRDAVIAALQTEFSLSWVSAHAVLDLQFSRLTPEWRAITAEELGDVERRLAAIQARAEDASPEPPA